MRINEAERRVVAPTRLLTFTEWIKLYRLAQADGITDVTINEAERTLALIAKEAGVSISSLDEAVLTTMAGSGWQIERYHEPT